MSSVSSDSTALRTIDWNDALVEQLDWHWVNQARPRLDGLTDDEYLWEPVPGCWNIRPDGQGGFTYDYVEPEPEPPPVTTIGWRLGHIAGPVLGFRAHNHFGTGVSPQDLDLPGTADAMLALLDQMYEDWTAGVRALGEDGLPRPCGPAEGPFAEYPLAALVLHINREAIHHLAEVALLRDLYRDRETDTV
jgi:hypothetical protein